MHPDQPNFFSGPYIERCTDAREELDWLAAAFTDPQTQFLLGRGTTQLLHTGSRPHIAFVPAGHPAVQAAAAHQFVLLGWFQGRRCVLLMLPPRRMLACTLNPATLALRWPPSPGKNLVDAAKAAGVKHFVWSRCAEQLHQPHCKH